MKRLRVCSIAVALPTVLLCASCASHIAKRGLDPYLRNVAEANAVNCGRIRFPMGTPHELSIEQARHVASCISLARAKRRPFFFSAGGPGVDSEVATGLVGSDDGRLSRFWYDSAPCGGPHCPESFHQQACTSVATGEDIDPTTFCVQRHEAHLDEVTIVDGVLWTLLNGTNRAQAVMRIVPDVGVEMRFIRNGDVRTTQIYPSFAELAAAASEKHEELLKAGWVEVPPH